MKKGELYGLHQSLSEAARTSKGIKLGYALIKSIRFVEKDIMTLEDLRKPSEEFQEYDRKRIDICLAHAEKDDKGQPKTMMSAQNNKEYVITDRPAFEKAIEELREQYKAAVDDHEARKDKYNQELASECTPKVHKIKFSEIVAEQDDLKKQGMTVADLMDADKLNKIWSIVEDDGDLPVSSEKSHGSPAKNSGDAKHDLKMMK